MALSTSSESQGGVELPTYKPIARQPQGFDLLRIPGLRRFVRWKHARLVFQLPLLALALFVILDGFFGVQRAPRNVATTAVWLHYRGLVVLALALVGNAFCAACPLMLTRGATRRLEWLLPGKLSWPRFLKNKVFVLLLTFFYLFSYEYFDLWASPWLTAWLAVGYFGAALVVDTLFKAGTFCRYVCPLGNFNFVFASASPTQITAVDHDICRSCEHKPCLQGRYTEAGSEKQAAQSVDAHEMTRRLWEPRRSFKHPLPLQTNGNQAAAFIPLSEITNANGAGHFPGCETELFVPSMQSNMDCTNCFNCVRACPYDNVAFTLRAPGWEWSQAPWQKRGRFALLLFGVVLTFLGLLNAIAMIGPWFAFAGWISSTFNTTNEFAVLMTLFSTVVLSGVAVMFGVSMWADRLGGASSAPVEAFMRWGYVTVALGFGFWGAHYIFHFLTGALSIFPVFQHFFANIGLPVDPNWRLSQIVPSRWFFPINAGITAFYTGLAIITAIRIALRDFGRKGVLAMWPIIGFILLFAAVSVWVLGQPMEMRGTIFLGPSY